VELIPLGQSTSFPFLVSLGHPLLLQRVLRSVKTGKRNPSQQLVINTHIHKGKLKSSSHTITDILQFSYTMHPFRLQLSQILLRQAPHTLHLLAQTQLIRTADFLDTSIKVNHLAVPTNSWAALIPLEGDIFLLRRPCIHPEKGILNLVINPQPRVVTLRALTMRSHQFLGKGSLQPLLPKRTRRTDRRCAEVKGRGRNART